MAAMARLTARLWKAALSARRSSLLMPPRGTAVLVRSPALPWLHLPGAGERKQLILPFDSRVSLYFSEDVFGKEQCLAEPDLNVKWIIRRAVGLLGSYCLSILSNAFWDSKGKLSHFSEVHFYVFAHHELKRLTQLTYMTILYND